MKLLGRGRVSAEVRARVPARRTSHWPWAYKLPAYVSAEQLLRGDVFNHGGARFEVIAIVYMSYGKVQVVGTQPSGRQDILYYRCKDRVWVYSSSASEREQERRRMYTRRSSDEAAW